MAEAYIFDALRTPRGKGKKDGGLHQATPVWLLRTLLQALRARNALDTSPRAWKTWGSPVGSNR